MSQVELAGSKLPDRRPAVAQAEAFTMVLDWLAGGVAGCIAKTATAPIERVKLLIQTQAANPRIMSGEVKAYSGMASTVRRVCAEQGVGALWRGNVPNCIRFFPTQAFNFAFKDRYKHTFLYQRVGPSRHPSCIFAVAALFCPFTVSRNVLAVLYDAA